MDAKKVARAVMIEDLAVRIISVRAAMAIANETHARLGIALDYARKKHRRPKPFMARLIQMHARAGAEAAFLSARHEVLSHNLKLYETMSVQK